MGHWTLRIEASARARRSCGGDRSHERIQRPAVTAGQHDNEKPDTMCSPDQTNRLLPAKACAGSKKPHAHALVVYDPAAAAQRASAGALVPYAAPRVDGEPINAVPLAAAPGRVRAEPWWLRKRLFPHLRLRFDLPVHFIAEKAVTVTDLDPHQNRFRLPTDGVVANLRPILSREELEAANLHDDAMGPKQRATKEDLQQGRKKRKGKNHGGLPVLVINVHGGIKELEMSQWESSRGTVIKGDGYMDFITRCGFKQGDVVETWAFKERHFRFFGVTMCRASPLFLVITKKKE